jgi:hypothetical protein
MNWTDVSVCLAQNDQWVVLLLPQVSMVPGSRVLTKADYEQQKDTHKDATAICLW